MAVIGYPAEDPRNDLADQARLFGGMFDVKRLAPGQVMGVQDAVVFTHDCTTLGGSSGSVVVDVATGSALGLHFPGGFLAPTSPSAPRRRCGSWPAWTRSRSCRPQQNAAGGQGDPAVPVAYLRFSIATHAERRMALFTAVNIDGAQARKIWRKNDVWSFVPRLPDGAQVGNAVYAGNDLDRGHVVRRVDPVWGGEAEAATAEKDTFFFTNSTPQHARFNQHLWLELEDYLRDQGDTLDFRACVFTGPAFDEDDNAYRGVLLRKAALEGRGHGPRRPQRADCHRLRRQPVRPADQH